MFDQRRILITLSIGIRAFPSFQGRPDIAIGGSFGYFQVPAAGRGSLCAQKRSSLRTKIVLGRHEAYDEADPFGVGPIRPRSMNDRIVM